jgi:NADH dehydrogenase/NADH:ubiquinone oxidoreductase subunit G
MTQLLTTQEIVTAASASMQDDGDIRKRVHDLTLRALRERRLDAAEVNAVVRSVAEGVSLGAEQRTGEVKEALESAISGLDAALLKAAQATHLALQEMISQGKDFSAQDLQPALDDLKITEQAFLDILSQVAEATGGRIKQELKAAVEHARLSGTDTGASIKSSLSDLSSRMSATLQAGKASGQEAAQTVTSRLAALASGILAGMAEALHEKSQQHTQKK